MSRFLDEMALSAKDRVAQAARAESLGALEQRAKSTPAAAPLRLDGGGFDVIAEIKLRSPALGVLGHVSDDWPARAAAYARAGAAAVSVLTEPSRFDGSLAHLSRVAALLAPFGIPAMRKDFIVDPYQVVEARAAGAGGVLLILRLLSQAQAFELLDAAAAHGLFVLLEAFDAADLQLAGAMMRARKGREEFILTGVNSRDLQTLEVVPQRFAALAPELPADWPAVAESGVATAAEARSVRDLGYRLALIGTALMTRPDPAALLRDILAAARTPKI